MWRHLIPVTLALALGAVFAFTLVRIASGDLDVRQIESPLIGRPAPPFELPSLRDPGATVGTRQLEGQMYLLNVWGTWCPGCRQEHEALLAIAASSGVPIIGLNWKDDRELALQWLQQLGDPYAKVAVDAEGRTAIDWGVYGAPETFLVSPQGVVLQKHIGPLDQKIWLEKFVPHLGRAGGA